MNIKWNRNAMAYSTTVVAATMMNSVFQFYYVKLFLRNYGISTYWFNLAQILYMVWNAINDPLFGYFQDYSNINCLKHRKLNILYGAPFFVLSFLLPWFGWVDTLRLGASWVAGMHLVISLCFYDCMFTFVLLAHCSLFTESSRDEMDRQSNIIYSQVATIVGSSSVFFCEIISNQMKDMRALQVACVVIAILSYLLMRYTARNITVVVDRSEDQDQENQGWALGLKTSLQILTNRNFIAFVTMNFLQIFHQTVCANFFSIFREGLIGTEGLPGFLQSAIAGFAFILPPVTILLLNPVLKKYGSYIMIKCSFVLKILMAFIVYYLGYGSPIVVGTFMVLDSTFVSACFSLFNLSVSHIIDDDEAQNKRLHPVSSMIFGLNALFTKPAQSLAPMLVVYVLKLNGYQADAVKQGKTSDTLKDTMFSVMVVLPIVVGFIQLLCWKMFTLRGKDNKQTII